MKYIVFLRAINVGGHATVRMEDLRAAFKAADCRNVTSYIQSGNLLFERPAIAPAALLAELTLALRTVIPGGARPILRTAKEMENLCALAPFKSGSEPGCKFYVVFLGEPLTNQPALPLLVESEAMEIISMTERELFVVNRSKQDGTFGFPNGFVEKRLKVSATTRNWNTILKMRPLWS